MDLAEAALTRLVGSALCRREIDRGGRKLRWLQTPGTGRPIVLSVGAGDTAVEWAALIGPLAARGPVIAYDRAGLGASDAMARLTGPAEVDDLAALLATVGPSVVVGHSWGGLLAQLVAFAHPDRIAGLVLVDPTVEDLFAAIPLRLRLSAAVTLRGMVLKHALGLGERTFRPSALAVAGRCDADAETRALVVRAYLAAYASRAQVATVGAENRIASRSARWVRPIRAGSTLPDVPVVVLSAGRKPAVLRDHARARHAEIAAGVPRGEFVGVDDAGHYIQDDRPDAVLAAVDRVIARCS
jgi:pimeloyl-ACP methyl ester carboxylesterase